MLLRIMIVIERKEEIEMNMLSVIEASRQKGCSRQAIWAAIKKEKIDAKIIGRVYVVFSNGKFQDWQPNPRMQRGQTILEQID
jgi:hypothetical protein